MCTTAIYDLLGQEHKEYITKMLHPVPKADVVQRERYLLEAAKGRCLLDIGASGPMSDALRSVAGEYHSLNLNNAEFCIDLDRAESLPVIPGLELVIAGEVIEHLSNAGHFLDLLKLYDCPIILTTPNAFSATGRYHNEHGTENVNAEHVAWYSWHTFTTLATRHGYNILDWYWYNGEPYTAEGLIFVIEVKEDA